jgi:hypothetical protein
VKASIASCRSDAYTDSQEVLRASKEIEETGFAVQPNDYSRAGRVFLRTSALGGSRKFGVQQEELRCS